MRFRSFGHESCSLDPSSDGESKDGLYGRLDCGGNFAGLCTLPTKTEVTPQLCMEGPGERSTVKNGTIFQMMAVCRF